MSYSKLTDFGNSYFAFYMKIRGAIPETDIGDLGDPQRK